MPLPTVGCPWQAPGVKKARLYKVLREVVHEDTTGQGSRTSVPVMQLKFKISLIAGTSASTEDNKSMTNLNQLNLRLLSREGCVIQGQRRSWRNSFKVLQMAYLNKWILLLAAWLARSLKRRNLLRRRSWPMSRSLPKGSLALLVMSQSGSAPSFTFFHWKQKAWGTSILRHLQIGSKNHII